MNRTQSFRIIPHELMHLGVSLRRHFVDDFHFREIKTFSPGDNVLDLGGTRIGKRGFFDVEQYGLDVVYANLSTAKRPHVQARAEMLPFADRSFTGVICSELLEHVYHPPSVLSEIHRVLVDGGTLLLCVPFLARIHADPYDFGRYTDYYWIQALKWAGFTGITAEKQGLFWSVLVDMLRDLVCRASYHGIWSKPMVTRGLARMTATAKRKAIEWDAHAAGKQDAWSAGFTTGFGITARKG